MKTNRLDLWCITSNIEYHDIFAADRTTNIFLLTKNNSKLIQLFLLAILEVVSLKVFNKILYNISKFQWTDFVIFKDTKKSNSDKGRNCILTSKYSAPV